MSALAARVWGAAAASRLPRALVVRDGAKVIAIGGATLGGSGKTPLAVACARRLAMDGHSVALVGHAYRAKPDRSRVVSPADAVEIVGDEALVAAQALEDVGVAVVVGPGRQVALESCAQCGPRRGARRRGAALAASCRPGAAGGRRRSSMGRRLLPAAW